MDYITSIKDYIDNLIQTTDRYIPSWNKENFKGKWNYIDGVFLKSIVELYYYTKDEKYKNFFINFINYYIDENGNFVLLNKAFPAGYMKGELDSVCESYILFDAYKLTNDKRYLIAIEKTYDALINQPKMKGMINFMHKTMFDNMLVLDGFYMYSLFYSRYAKTFNKKEIYDEIMSQLKNIKELMYDENKKLYYQSYDNLGQYFWSDKNKCSKTFWLRGIGWLIMAMCDIIEFFDDEEYINYLKSLLKESIDGILLYQDEKSKMLYQIVDKKDEEYFIEKGYLEFFKNTKYMKNGEYVDSYIKNYLESSGTSMIAYALIKGARLGYLDNSYLKKGRKMFEGIFNHSFSDNKLHDICITAGVGANKEKYRDGTIKYYLAEPVGSNDAKGVGPFIMSFIEYFKCE